MVIEKVVIFVVGEERFSIPLSKISAGTYLSAIINTSMKVEKDINVRDNVTTITLNPNVGITAENFEVIYDFLVKGIAPSFEDLDIVAFFGIEETSDYGLACVREDHMRANMYQEEWCDNVMNTDPYYNLIKVDQKMWERLVITKKEDPDLLFNTVPLVKQSWSNIAESLNFHKELLALGNIFVAGGSIFSALFGTPSNDVDIFIHGCDEETAISKIHLIKQEFAECAQIEGYELNYIRTANAISFESGVSDWKEEWQVILRLYRSPSEILHGFDVDSCCMGYDGKDIWITQRCLFSIINGFNTVNFERLSPSYEFRLAKYGSRGMAVKIPNTISTIGADDKSISTIGANDKSISTIGANDKSISFNRTTINKERLEHYFGDKGVNCGNNLKTRYKHVNGLKGIDILLFLEERWKRSKVKASTAKAFNTLSKKRSDYLPIMGNTYLRHGGIGIPELLKLVLESAENYPKQRERYIASLKEVLIHDEDEDGIFSCLDDYDIKSKYSCASEFRVSHLGPKTTSFLIGTDRENGSDEKRFKLCLNIEPHIYEALGNIRPWEFPADIAFKKINPGEQMTNTFHQIVLADNKVWFDGFFYSKGNEESYKAHLDKLEHYRTSIRRKQEEHVRVEQRVIPSSGMLLPVMNPFTSRPIIPASPTWIMDPPTVRPRTPPRS